MSVEHLIQAYISKQKVRMLKCFIAIFDYIFQSLYIVLVVVMNVCRKNVLEVKA